MKIAISGKGGVGKTTFAATLALLLARDGYEVIAVDADPDANLASALGIAPDEAGRVMPLAQMKDLVKERTGAEPGAYGGYFKLNPYVSDIPEKYSLVKDGVRLLVMGGAKPGGSGCVCPENVLLKNLVNHLLLRANEVVVMDMEAGIEHLSRGTARAVDAFVTVVEPGARSLQTARYTRDMAKDIGINSVWVVGNKVRSEEDQRFVRENLPDFEVLGFIPYDPKVAEADMQGKSLLDAGAVAVKDIAEIEGRLLELVREAEPERKGVEAP